MPFFNGIFYANPAYGAALERAREEEQGHGDAGQRVAQQAHPPNSTPGHSGANSETQLANRIYNETSGLRASGSRGAGGMEDLQNARAYIGQAMRNREAAGNVRGIASDRIQAREERGIRTYPPARAAYEGAQTASREVLAGRGPGGGIDHFYLDYGQPQPRWAVGRTPVAYFGPFLNAAGGGNVPRGRLVKIRVYRLEDSQ